MGKIAERVAETRIFPGESRRPTGCRMREADGSIRYFPEPQVLLSVRFPSMKTNKTETEKEMRNEDPLSGAPGAHPVGSGVGAALGGIVGGAIGAAVGGPVGAAAGASMVAGAVAGGLIGKAAGEAVDPTVEDAYWREHHMEEPFANEGPYETYAPAYRSGYEGFGRSRGRRFEEVESDIQRDYEGRKASVPWPKARPAAMDAFNRVYERNH